jgi:hypothetical protein
MASERALKLGVAASVLALMALAVAADTLSAAPEPRRIVLCALLGLVPACVLWQCLRKLGLPVPRMEPQGGGQEAASSPRPNELAANLLALEARLEHVPIALFQIQHAGGAGRVLPLNASARRLLAPGRASAPQDLHQLLAAQPVGQRKLITFDTERGGERALVAISALSVQGSAQRLAALMPVESELEAEALNAWRELVQVLRPARRSRRRTAGRHPRRSWDRAGRHRPPRRQPGRLCRQLSQPVDGAAGAAAAGGVAGFVRAPVRFAGAAVAGARWQGGVFGGAGVAGGDDRSGPA